MLSFRKIITNGCSWKVVTDRQRLRDYPQIWLLTLNKFKRIKYFIPHEIIRKPGKKGRERESY